MNAQMPVTGSLALIAALGVSAPASAAPATRPLATFTVDRTSGGFVHDYKWTVPKNLRKVIFDVRGASGGGTVAVPGGRGGRTRATVAVQPGWVFQIVLGGEGSVPAELQFAPNGGGPAGGESAFGGGGGSDVRAGDCAATLSCGFADRVIVAGGGGGAGESATIGAGGDGGGLTGDRAPGCTFGGHGGTQTAGFLFGLGGNGASSSFVSDGGGGGGGWWGGSGGQDGGCGGGGGSGHVDPLVLLSSMENGAHSGDGVVSVFKG